jgi:hypothetical protein
MTGEQQQTVWGAPTDRPTTWSTRTTLAAIGIAAALAAVGGVVVYAATAHNEAQGHGGPPGWGGPGGPGGPGGSQRTLHGQNVVSNGEGGFTTQLTQTGDVTAASDTSVTVRSQDGFSQTYVFGPDTRKPPQALQTGQQVSVQATQLNGAATATTVMPAR